MLSSLSSVPPVMPRPRPEIIGTHSSSQASRGARMSETLSPMPPVRVFVDLRRRARGIAQHAAAVHHRAGEVRWFPRAVMPRKKTAMAQALAW